MDGVQRFQRCVGIVAHVDHSSKGHREIEKRGWASGPSRGRGGEGKESRMGRAKPAGGRAI